MVEGRAHAAPCGEPHGARRRDREREETRHMLSHSPPFSIILFVIFWRVRPRRSFKHHPCTVCKATQPPALLEMTECRRVKARRLSALIAPKQRPKINTLYDPLEIMVSTTTVIAIETRFLQKTGNWYSGSTGPCHLQTEGLPNEGDGHKP